MKKIIIILIVGTAIILARQPIIQASQQLYNKWMTLTLVLDHIEKYYVTPKDPDQLLDFAIEGVLNRLDPYSKYLSPEAYDKWQNRSYSYHGIGLKYTRIDDRLYVTSLIEGGPAEQAGIRLGDKITHIANQAIHQLDNADIKKLLSMTASKNLQLSLLDSQNQSETLIIPQSKIPVISIPCAYMFDSSTGYIRLDHFNDMTAYELDRAFAKLNLQGVKNLVLDLRDNRGGTLEAGINVADRLIPGHRLLVYIKGRSASSLREYYGNPQKTLPIIPLVVLVNDRTASDAEIVAGAIQDWDRGLLVGQKTFGKAMIQSEFPFQDGSVLLLTTAVYYTPLGRCIQKQLTCEKKTFKTPQGRTVYGGGGIQPDIVIETDQDTLPPLLSRLYHEKGNLFFHFADHFIKQTDIQESEPQAFLRTFQIDSNMLNAFQSHVNKKGLPLTDSMLRDHEKILKNALKTEIAGRLWGDEGRYIAQTMQDPEIDKALKTIPQATRLLRP